MKTQGNALRLVASNSSPTRPTASQILSRDDLSTRFLRRVFELIAAYGGAAPRRQVIGIAEEVFGVDRGAAYNVVALLVNRGELGASRVSEEAVRAKLIVPSNGPKVIRKCVIGNRTTTQMWRRGPDKASAPVFAGNLPPELLGKRRTKKAPTFLMPANPQEWTVGDLLKLKEQLPRVWKSIALFALATK